LRFEGEHLFMIGNEDETENAIQCLRVRAKVNIKETYLQRPKRRPLPVLTASAFST